MKIQQGALRSCRKHEKHKNCWIYAHLNQKFSTILIFNTKNFILLPDKQTLNHKIINYSTFQTPTNKKCFQRLPSPKWHKTLCAPAARGANNHNHLICQFHSHVSEVKILFYSLQKRKINLFIKTNCK